jgi:CRISPR-associated protein Csb3
MSDRKLIQVPVDITNPGQFFACCGLLEIADRLWPGAQGWFDGGNFLIDCGGSIGQLLKQVSDSSVTNTMTAEQNDRLKELSALSKRERESLDGADDERKQLESLRRELPIVIGGRISLRIDWFTDEYSGGARFKTWAGQQSVIDIAQNMHKAIRPDADIWTSERKTGLPFNFDSDLGSQGSALDIGFSFDPLAGNELTRIEGACRPILEFLSFVGLQRFRPKEAPGRNRFVYTAWRTPLFAPVAAAVACEAVAITDARRYAFSLLYRTKYLKSFLPAARTDGEYND